MSASLCMHAKGVDLGTAEGCPTSLDSLRIRRSPLPSATSAIPLDADGMPGVLCLTSCLHGGLLETFCTLNFSEA